MVVLKKIKCVQNYLESDLMKDSICQDFKITQNVLLSPHMGLQKTDNILPEIEKAP